MTTSPKSTLRLELRAGESIQIGEDVTLLMEEKTGRVARLTIAAPRTVPIKQQRPASTTENPQDLQTAKS